jgi:signal transduction histidine kinase
VTRSPVGWWRARSLRLRVTAAATLVLAAGLAVGVGLLSWVFVHSRVSVVDRSIRTEIATISALASSDSLPQPLPEPASGSGFAQVIDGKGAVVAATAATSDVLPMLPMEQVTANVGHAFTARSSALGPASMRFVVEPTTYGGALAYVVAAAPLTDVTTTLNALGHVLLIALPILVLAAAAATWAAVGAALQPVDRLRADADAVGPRELAGASPPALDLPASGDELRRLAATLNRMLERLHGSATQQRAFIADAAHELRSPIASVRTQLEVGLAVPNEPDAWPVIVQSALDDVERLSRVADDLLLLARLDSGAAPLPRREISLASLVDPAVLAEPHTDVCVIGDATSLGRAITNLVENARRYAKTRVEVSIEHDDTGAAIHVDDDGPGIAASDRTRALERWVRLDADRSRAGGGSGLGLAIARDIARAHGGDVVLDDSPLGGLRATIRLPLR